MNIIELLSIDWSGIAGSLAACGSLALAYLVHRQSKVDMSIYLRPMATYHRMKGFSDEVNILTLTNHSNRTLHYGSNLFTMQPWHYPISKWVKKWPAFTFKPDYPPILLEQGKDDFTIKAGQTKSYALHLSGEMADSFVWSRITATSTSPKKRFKSSLVKKSDFHVDTKGRHTWERYVMETFFPGYYSITCSWIWLTMSKQNNALSVNSEYMKGMDWINSNIKSEWIHRFFNRETQVTSKNFKDYPWGRSWDHSIGSWGYDYLPEVELEGYRDSDMEESNEHIEQDASV